MSNDTIEDESLPDGRATLTSHVYARMRADIIEGQLKPGLKLKIEKLRDTYDVGASPIREALSLLSSDALVKRIDHRGFRVADVSRDEFVDILNVRCWLEERGLRESIEHGGADWEESIMLASFRLSKKPRSIGENSEFIANPDWEQRHRQLHQALISACGSQTLITYCNQLYDQAIRYRHLAGPTSYPGRDIAKEHDDIVQAALERNADRAVELLLAHYRNTSMFLAEALP